MEGGKGIKNFVDDEEEEEGEVTGGSKVTQEHERPWWSQHSHVGRTGCINIYQELAKTAFFSLLMFPGTVSILTCHP